MWKGRQNIYQNLSNNNFYKKKWTLYDSHLMILYVY